jgi:formyl-CoA transferase
VPCGPINTLDRLFADPQVAARNMVVEMNHPTAGQLRSIGNPVKTPPMTEGPFEPPPRHGQHTEQVLRETLGYSAEHIAQLRENKVIGFD